MKPGVRYAFPTLLLFINAWYKPKPVIYNLAFLISFFNSKFFIKFGENISLFLGLINFDSNFNAVSNFNSSLFISVSTINL